MTGFDASWLWAFGLLGVAAGFTVGVIIGFRYLSNKPRLAELEQQIEAAKAEQADYKQQVTTHFAKTAELFQNMTDSYRNVYQHLAEGSNQLCSDIPQAPQLDLPDSATLADLGQSTSVAEEEAPEAESVAVESPQAAEQPAEVSAATPPADKPKPAGATEADNPSPPAASAVSEFESANEEEEKDQTVLH